MFRALMPILSLSLLSLNILSSCGVIKPKSGSGKKEPIPCALAPKKNICIKFEGDYRWHTVSRDLTQCKYLVPNVEEVEATFCADQPQPTLNNVSTKVYPNPDAKMPSPIRVTQIFPSFDHNEFKVVPVDITEAQLELKINHENKTVVATSTIVFSVHESGIPAIHFNPDPKSLAFEGESVPLEQFIKTETPDKKVSIRSIERNLEQGISYTLSVSYDFPEFAYQFDGEKIDLKFEMSDVPEFSAYAGFMDLYSLSNFEFDQYPLKLSIEVDENDSSYVLFANGKTSQLDNAYTASFPGYFNAASFFIHFTSKPEQVLEARHGSIPIKVYGGSAEENSQAIDISKKVLASLETLFDSYSHESLTVYLHDPQGGSGMEYAGATITSLWALEHEITHSWFARSLMPANGRSGWIDEAIASWRDYEYPTTLSEPWTDPIVLAYDSPYAQNTPTLSYDVGPRLLARIDYELRDTEFKGLQAYLKTLYLEQKNSVITTEFFKEHLEYKTKLDFSELFDRYVYGKETTE